MNGKTAKLLREYNNQVLEGNKKQYRRIKKWWNDMNWKERTKARVQIKEQVMGV